MCSTASFLVTRHASLRRALGIEIKIDKVVDVVSVDVVEAGKTGRLARDDELGDGVDKVGLHDADVDGALVAGVHGGAYALDDVRGGA